MTREFLYGLRVSRHNYCLTAFPLQILPTTYRIYSPNFSWWSSLSWFMHVSLYLTFCHPHILLTLTRDPQCAVLYSTYNFIYILHRQFPVYKLLVPTPLFLLLDHITFPSQCIWVISAWLTPPTKFADFLYGIPGLTHFLRNPCNILCRTQPWY